MRSPSRPSLAHPFAPCPWRPLSSRGGWGEVRASGIQITVPLTTQAWCNRAHAEPIGAKQGHRCSKCYVQSPPSFCSVFKTGTDSYAQPPSAELRATRCGKHASTRSVHFT
eukprot:4768777-Prymnesium_polylepis.1